MEKGDKDQAVFMGVKLSHHSTKHSDVLEVSSKGMDCDLKRFSRLNEYGTTLYAILTFGCKNVFSFFVLN